MDNINTIISKDIRTQQTLNIFHSIILVSIISVITEIVFKTLSFPFRRNSPFLVFNFYYTVGNVNAMK